MVVRHYCSHRMRNYAVELPKSSRYLVHTTPQDQDTLYSPLTRREVITTVAVEKKSLSSQMEENTLRCGCCGIVPDEDVLLCRLCHHYRVCLTCIKGGDGEIEYERHGEECKGPTKEINRRFLLATTDGSIVDGMTSLDFDACSSECFEPVPSRFRGKPRLRSPNYLWYRYKSGILVTGTAVCYRLPIGEKSKILHGRLISNSGLEATVRFDDGRELSIPLSQLYLQLPSPISPRRATSIHITECKACWFVTWTPGSEEKPGQWIVTTADIEHVGHPEPTGERPLGKRALSYLPEAVAVIKEFKDSGIPDKYIGLLVENRLSSNFQVRTDAIRQIRGDTGFTFSHLRCLQRVRADPQDARCRERQNFLCGAFAA